MAHDKRKKTGLPPKALALLGGLLFSTNLQAAQPEPLPPPPELLNDAGYVIDPRQPPPAGSRYVPYNNAYDNYGQPRPVLPEFNPAAPLPPAQYAPPATAQPIYVQPGQPYSGQPRPAQPPVTIQPYIQPVPAPYPPPQGQPPQQPVPGQPYFAQNPQPQPQPPARQPFRPSGPSANMPADYFNLPLTVEDGAIPGIILPELDPDFVDPGQASLTGKRYIQPGMNVRQLEPFFELAKGHEKAALDFKRGNDERLYRENLSRAVAGYMEIIAMADASNEAREEAWYGVARCEYRLENWWRAFDALERSFPERFELPEVEGRVKLEMFIGERLWRMGHAPVPESRKTGDPMSGYQAAARVYAAVLFNHPNSPDAPLAMLRRGDAAAMDEEWKEAAKLYRSVVEYYPESEEAMQARSSLTEAVYRQEWEAGFPEAARQDLARVMDSVERNDDRLSPPAEERRRRAVTAANNLEAENLLRTAKSYLAQIRVRKSRDAAVFQLGEIVSHYPDTPQAEEAADLLRDMGIEPPMVLSEGDRFPLVPTWHPEIPPSRGEVRLGDDGRPAPPAERPARERENEPPRTAAPNPAPPREPAARDYPEYGGGNEGQRRQKVRTPRSAPSAGGRNFSPIRPPDPIEEPPRSRNGDAGAAGQ